MNKNENLLTVSELLSRSFAEIRARFVPLMLLAACAPALLWLLQGLLIGFSPLDQATAREAQPWLVSLISLINGLCGLGFTASLIFYICKREDTILQALKAGFKRIPRLLLAFIPLSLVIILSSVLLIAILAGGLYFLDVQPTTILVLGMFVFMPLWGIGLSIFSIYISLWYYPLVLTDEPIWATLRLSLFLVKGRFWQTFGILFILGLISFGLALAGVLALGALSFITALVSSALSAVVSFLWIPITALMVLVMQVPMVALYLNRSMVLIQTQEQAPTEENI